MFLIQRPSAGAIQRFIDESRDLPLSYEPVGIARTGADGFDVDETTMIVGRGDAAFERARAALVRWAQFELGWTELHPRHASIEPGTVAAVLIRHLGFWSLNGCRVAYRVGDRDAGPRFGFAYGTLTNHAEAGEELFEVALNPETGDVTYRIRAASRPRAALARIGYPVVRALQARFRRDSAAAMIRAQLVPR
jgi:uncharacterized protein (UPF0548 family)